MSNTMNARVVFSRHLCAALFCCGMALTAFAREWLIPSPDDGNEAAVTALTNALANCAEKDVVTLAKGVYDLAGVIGSTGGGGAIVVTESAAMGAACYLTNCVFRGNTSHGTDGAGVVARATMYGCLAESNVASAGTAGALKYGYAFDTVFRNNQAVGGGACAQVVLSNCLLEGNVAQSGRGGAVAYSCWATNCTFRHNVAANGPGGALEKGRNLLNCSFIGNMGTGNGGALVDQQGMVSNWVKDGGSQGAIHVDTPRSVVVQDCVFTNNASGWSGGVGGGVSVWSNCVFVGNSIRAADGKVAGTVGGTYYSCTFRGQWSTTAGNRVDPTNDIPRITRWMGALAVNGGTLLDCTVEGCVTNCVLTRCTLIGSTNLPLVVAANCALTNCLVVGNRLARDAATAPLGVFYAGSGGTSPTLVNCTVVDNAGTLFAVSGGTAVNTLFFGNTAGDGTAVDISGGGSSAAPLALDHCLYGTCTALAEAVSFSDCVALAAGESPKFNAGQYADYPYYMPRRTSKAVDAGVALAWDADAIDRGGFPRVFGKAVDIGCYEACLPHNGFLMIVR